MGSRQSESLKARTAHTLKWNTVDRFSSQVLYAVTGVVLANVLSEEDFGLVGVILVFQAFALLFVDSGFGAALLQKKNPTQADYSTVFWFNLIVGCVVYTGLWFSAPLIADFFHSDQLVSLSRVMFLSFFINGLAIVQTNRLMKNMDVKQIAVSNIAGLSVSGAIGIWLALSGYGAWSIVWQTVSLAIVRSAWLWLKGGWIPSAVWDKESFREIWRVGIGVFSSSFLNTVCLNIYSFIIGRWFRLASLGIYTQADKWSKMGVASLSQIFTSTFVALLSRFQDDMAKFSEAAGKVLRLSAFIVCPFMVGLIVMGEPIFHLLFGDKWDSSIPLFQILCGRGLLLVMVSVFNNFLLALGKAKVLVVVEVVKDVLLIGAIFCTIGFGTLEALVWGQFWSAVATFIIVLGITSRHIMRPAMRMLLDMAPYVLLTMICAVGMYFIGEAVSRPWLALILESLAGIFVYSLVLKASGSKIFSEALAYIRGKSV